MTTGWSAARVDPAPRIAYELCAAVAGDGEAVAEKIWDGLNAPARARVVAALGAQARHTARGAAAASGINFPALMAGDVRARLQGCEGREAALAALAAAPVRRLPGDGACPAPAIALARARLLVFAALGFTPGQAAEICRRAAARG